MIGSAPDAREDIEADVHQLAEENLFACQLTILHAVPQHRAVRQMEREGTITETDLSKFDLYHLTWRHPTIAPERCASCWRGLSAR